MDYMSIKEASESGEFLREEYNDCAQKIELKVRFVLVEFGQYQSKR